MVDRLRLALVSRRYPPQIGGAELVMSYLARALANVGADVTVFTAATPDMKVCETYSALSVERVPTSTTRFLGTFLYMRNLRRRLISGCYDLIYVSMLKHDAYVSVDIGIRMCIPVVLRPEGAGATGDLAWQAWGRFGSEISTRCKQADALVAISPAIHHELNAAGYNPAKIHDLPNGVPIPEFPWIERSAWVAEPRAVYVGRLAPEKNLRALVEQWPSVVAIRPRATLTLVGEGPERPALERLVDQLGLSGLVTLPGASSDPMSILRTSDLFVLPSHEEGMSIALLEAMALGIPIVASAIAGNMRLISAGEQGMLASITSTSSCGDAILAQWADFAGAIRMGKAARQRVIETFSIDAVARQHLSLFHDLIRKKSANRAGS